MHYEAKEYTGCLGSDVIFLPFILMVEHMLCHQFPLLAANIWIQTGELILGEGPVDHKIYVWRSEQNNQVVCQA